MPGLIINLSFPPETPDEVMAEAALKLAGACDALHQALGGHGMKLDSVETIREDGTREEFPWRSATTNRPT